MQSRQQQCHPEYTGSDADSLRSNDSSSHTSRRGHTPHYKEDGMSSRTDGEYNTEGRPLTPDRKLKPGEYCMGCNCGD